MKRMLCSLALLITMSAMGLLVESKSASSAPITLTDLQQELRNSNWEGTWESIGGDWSSGPAKLFLTVLHDNTVYVQLSIYESADGDYTSSIWGTMSGNTIKLTPRSGKIVLFLSQEKGEFVLKGKYTVTSGQYVGETGSYDFKIKKK